METAPTGDAGATQQPDHGYRDNITQIEPYGIDHIPDAERHGKASSQFFIWFAAGLNFPIMLLGFSAASLGLSLSAAIWAIIVGALIGSVAMGVMSRMGVHLGVPQQMQAAALSASSGTCSRSPTSTSSPGSAGPPSPSSSAARPSAP